VLLRLLNLNQPTIVVYCGMLTVSVYRILPDSIGLDKVAGKLKELNIHGLVLVGGFEVILLF